MTGWDFLILGGFTFCTFICLLLCGPNVSHFRRLSLFFWFCMFKCSIICVRVVFARVCMGTRETFYLWLFVSETIYNAAGACLPSILQVSDFFSVCCLSSLLVRVSACVCASVCERRATETEGELGVRRAPGNALFTMSVSGRQIRDAMPQMFQSISNNVRRHRKR